MIDVAVLDKLEAQCGFMPTAFLAAADVELFTDTLNDHHFLGDLDAGNDDELLQFIQHMEHAKAVIAAAQTRAAYRLWQIQHTRDQPRGIKTAMTAKSVGSQIALARRESPARGSRHLGFARALHEEMPATRTALSTGAMSEWHATLLVKETAYLTVADRACIDASLAPHAGAMSPRQLCAAATHLAYQLDPHAVVARRSRAEQHRRVTVRPAPDCMTHLSALLPLTAGVACHTALQHAADTARRAGDPRSRAQVMADTLTERITGHRTHEIPTKIIIIEHHNTPDPAANHNTAGHPTRPAVIAGYGPITDDLAHELTQHATTTTTYRADSKAAKQYKSRTAPPALRELITALDPHCRTPHCEAPARHIDHVQPHSRGGPTTLTNTQNLCEHCNYTKEHPDWHTQTHGPTHGFEQTITTTTASGWTYQSRRE